MDEPSPQHYFLRYAFPCAHVLRDQGRMTEHDHELLQELAKNGGDITFAQLQEHFPEAFRRIHEVAEKIGEEPHSKEAIRHYFLHDHQDYIDRGDGMYAEMPDSFKEFCKVRRMNVLRKRVVDDELFLQVDEERWVRAPFFKGQEVEEGDVVLVHHAFAIEREE